MLLSEELVINGNFAAWTLDNPTGWSVSGEVLGNGYGTGDPEVSQVATGQSHADAGSETGGMCNLYTSDGTNVYIRRIIRDLIVGGRYTVSIKVDTVTAGSLVVKESWNSQFPDQDISAAGTYSWSFVANRTGITPSIEESGSGTDITIANISVRQEVGSELSRTGQRFSSHQEI